jgi:signal transduction histidine kinase
VQPRHRKVDPMLEDVPGDGHHEVACLLPAATRKRIWAELDAGRDPEQARQAAGLPKEPAPEPAAAAAPAAAAKGIGIICEPNAHRALAEPTLLSHALGNLLSNAIRYSPRGSAVRLRAEQREEGVRISVTDRGPGIPAEQKGLLFKKFSRVASDASAAADSDSESGSGLGLYIVRTLAERMGASAGFEPNPDGGSTFYIDLPSSSAARTEPEIA